MIEASDINRYVYEFGLLKDRPNNVREVVALIKSIPDSQSFEEIRSQFYIKYRHPFLPTFLKDISEAEHIMVLHAFKRACGNYQ